MVSCGGLDSSVDGMDSGVKTGNRICKRNSFSQLARFRFKCHIHFTVGEHVKVGRKSEWASGKGLLVSGPRLLGMGM